MHFHTILFKTFHCVNHYCACIWLAYIQAFLRKMLDTWYGPVGTRFSILGTWIGSLKLV